MILPARPESEALLIQGSCSVQSLNVASAVIEHWFEFLRQLPAHWDPFLGIRGEWPEPTDLDDNLLEGVAFKSRGVFVTFKPGVDFGCSVGSLIKGASSAV